MHTVDRDPEGHEIEALDAAVEVDGCRMLEVGAGDGRLTWRYADRAGHVTAIDPDAQAIAIAVNGCPPELRDRVSLQAVGIEGFERDAQKPRFDVALLSWSL